MTEGFSAATPLAGGRCCKLLDKDTKLAQLLRLVKVLRPLSTSLQKNKPPEVKVQCPPPYALSFVTVIQAAS